MTVTTLIVAIGTVVIMVYSGLLFEPQLMRQQLVKSGMWLSLAQLSAVNYLLVPLATLVLIWQIPSPPGLNLAMLTLAFMPCAPVVPLLVNASGEPAEWPMFVFLVFSAFGLLLIPVMAALFPQPWAAGKYAELADDSVTRLIAFAVLSYLPLLLGIVFRVIAPGPGVTLRNTLRPYVSVCTIVTLGTVFVANFQQVMNVTLHDLLVMLLFIMVAAATGYALGPRMQGAPMNAILPTGFRNVALALTFANIVFPHTDASSFLFTMSMVMLMLTYITFNVLKRLRTDATA